jgi:hypothetical protein
MNTQHLMEQAEQVMARYVCDGLEGGARSEMEGMVHRFFSAYASGLDPSEIMDHMTTPMKAVCWFNSYLSEALGNCCCTDLDPEDADTCTLP